MCARHGRRKSIVVPLVLRGDDPPAFVVVRDRATGEWGFVCGGCRAREEFEEGALREMEEETRGALGRTDMRHPLCFDIHTRSHATSRKDPVGRSVYTHYRVFTFVLHTKVDVVRAFHAREARTRAEAETDDLGIFTMEEMQRMRLWEELQNKVMHHPALHRVVGTLESQQRFTASVSDGVPCGRSNRVGFFGGGGGARLQ